MHRMKICVCSMNIETGNKKYEKLAELSVPHMMRYAQRVGADFHLIQQRELSDSTKWHHIMWEKIQIKHLFQTYDRVFLVDIDCFITGNCPNVFENHEYPVFAGVNCGVSKKGWCPQFPKFLKFMGKEQGVDGNGGVILIDKPYSKFLVPPKNWMEVADKFCLSQMWLFSNMHWNGIKISKLESRYNKMNNHTGEGIYHMCGRSLEDRVKMIEKFMS